MLRSMSFILAAVSVLFEFTVAQLLTVFHGSTATVYFLTIGLYSFFLGVGAFFFHWASIKQKNSLKIFVYSEALLVASALMAPFVILLSGEVSILFLKLAIGFLPLSLIAFFSGIELPFLLSLDLKKSEKDQIIFWDFFGMFVAGLLFAIFFLDFLSVFQTLALSIFISSALLIYLLKFFNFYSPKVKMYYLLMTLISMVTFFNDNLLIEIFRGFHGY